MQTLAVVGCCHSLGTQAAGCVVAVAVYSCVAGVPYFSFGGLCFWVCISVLLLLCLVFLFFICVMLPGFSGCVVWL